MKGVDVLVLERDDLVVLITPTIDTLYCLYVCLECVGEHIQKSKLEMFS